MDMYPLNNKSRTLAYYKPQGIQNLMEINKREKNITFNFKS